MKVVQAVAMFMGYVSLAGAFDNNEPVEVLVYETDASIHAPSNTLVNQINGRINDMTVTVFGQGEGYKGYGSKFSAVLPLLKLKNPEALVVISDSRDVIVNNPYHDGRYKTTLAEEFKFAYNELTFDHPEAIVFSAEAQCCVSALTHAIPGSYFNEDGSRKDRACSSGAADCLWGGDDNAKPWESFMQALQSKRVTNHSDDMYLNAGLMVGTAKNLIRVIEAAQIADNEDDQAVFTDYMFHHPDQIILDYEQRLFGNNRGGVLGLESTAERCVFHIPEFETRLVHALTNTSPLFVHSPGGFYDCHDMLSMALGVPAISQEARKLLQQSRDLTNNYGRSSTLADALAGRDEDGPSTLEQYFLGHTGGRRLGM